MISSNIYHYFEKVITSESVGVKKPNPKVFLHALDLAKADKENSIMIGDSIEADIEGALSIGMKAIHSNFANNIISSNQFISITTLLDLKQYL